MVGQGHAQTMRVTAKAPPAACEPNAPGKPGKAAVVLSAVVIVIAGLAAYEGSFGCPFVFDDRQSIVENPTIRHLWPLGEVISMPHDAGYTVAGRPVVNFTLALNYALSGTDVWSYHGLNLAIHLCAGLVLFGVVRRTLRQPLLRDRFGAHATSLAWAVALLWTVHPLQTEAVTYVVQRVESLMGLMYLLTLYAFIRATEPPGWRRWSVVAVVACLIGMAAKEVMVTAPILVLLYDRTFVVGSFREAWRRRHWLYGALAATWIPLVWLVARTGWNRGGTSGFDVGIAPWAYWLTQFRAVACYLGLSAWPHPLVLDRETFWVHGVREVVPYALIVVPLVLGTGLALRRWPGVAFLGAAFFAILAPTSLMPGTIQMIVEHRMYLPLAAVITLGVMGLQALLGRRSYLAFGLLALAFGWLTLQRNHDYRSSVDLWQDTVAKCPANPRAHVNLGKALLDSGLAALAVDQYREALRLDPANVVARFNLGNALARQGRLAEACESYRAVLQLRPDFANAHFYLAELLARLGRQPEAVTQYEAALQLDPELADARCNLGNLLLSSSRIGEAIDQYTLALRIAPESPRIHYNLGNALVAASRLPEAVHAYEAALRLQPDYSAAQANLANALFQLGRTEEALAHFRDALRLEPDAADVRANFGVALLQLHRIKEAKEQFEQALRIDPQNEQARDGLAHATEGLTPPARDR